MLTADLLMATCRSGRVYPRYVKTSDKDLLELAGELIATFQEAADSKPPWRRGRLDEELADQADPNHSPIRFKGLCKLLFDRSEFEERSELDPETVRKLVFERAAGTNRGKIGQPWETQRTAILSAVAEELGTSATAVEAAMYVDLEENQRLTRFRPITADSLLDRYNLALAQAVLIRATELRLEVGKATPAAYRQLFRALKFRQLIHQIEPTEGGFKIVVDGPLSLFSSSTKYGVAIANFLPTLLLLDNWSLEADILWGKKKTRTRFELHPKVGLKTHSKTRGRYVTDEQIWFQERFGDSEG
ncbi:MAG: DUF790 family protein, partial [Myxococcales bacterium]|nr:DUF790 family protein [Myxococcales bacterium]